MGFKTANSIKLQPYDTFYDATFKFPVTSSGTLNDGTLPYGRFITGVTVTAWNGDTQVTDLIQGTPTISGTDTVLVSMNYPSTTMSGITRRQNMSLRFVLSLDNSATLEEDFHNIIVGDF